MKKSTDSQETRPRAARSRQSVRGKNGANHREQAGGGLEGVNVAVTKQHKRAVTDGAAALFDDPIAADNEQVKATFEGEDAGQLIEYVSLPQRDCRASPLLQAKCATYEERIRFLEIQLAQAIQSRSPNGASLEPTITSIQC